MSFKLSKRELAPPLSGLQAAVRQVNAGRALVAGQAARVAGLGPSQKSILSNAKRLLFIFQENLKTREQTLEALRRQRAE